MERDKDAISTLNSLIETCNDGAKGFETAAQEVRDSSARQLFQQYARERSQFADELRAEVQRLGGRPEQGGSVSGAVHRGWIVNKLELELEELPGWLPLFSLESP